MAEFMKRVEGYFPFSADTLATHEFLGFVRPSANHLFIDRDATRETIQVDFEDSFEMREIDFRDDAVYPASLR